MHEDFHLQPKSSRAITLQLTNQTQSNSELIFWQGDTPKPDHSLSIVILYYSVPSSDCVHL
jgi:hypothetical protein